MLGDVEAQRVAGELPFLGAHLALFDVATTRGVEHLEATTLAQDHAVELADVLDVQVRREQVLERELVVQDRLEVGGDLPVEGRVAPLGLGALVELVMGLLVLLGRLIGAAPWVNSCPRTGQSLDCTCHFGHSFQRVRTASQ